MALGMQIGLGPGHIVLDEDPAPLVKREAETVVHGQSPSSTIFDLFLL